MPAQEKLSDFTVWCAYYITGDEKRQPQIFLDRLFRVFTHASELDAMPGFD